MGGDAKKDVALLIFAPLIGAETPGIGASDGCIDCPINALTYYEISDFLKLS